MKLMNDMELNLVTGGSLSADSTTAEDKSMERIDKAADTVAKGIYDVLRALHFLCTL